MNPIRVHARSLTAVYVFRTTPMNADTRLVDRARCSELFFEVSNPSRMMKRSAALLYWQGMALPHHYARGGCCKRGPRSSSVQPGSLRNMMAIGAGGACDVTPS